MSDCVISDQSSNHHYRTELPNVLFELGLKANELSLYCAIKKSAGDNGQCTKSTKTLCKEAGVGERNFGKLKEALSKKFSIINKPLITVLKRNSDFGDPDTDLITIIDIWPENYRYFIDKLGGGAKLLVPGAKLQGGVPAKMQGGGAKLRVKEEPVNKNPIKKTTKERRRCFECLEKDERLSPKDRMDLMKFSEDRIKLALEYSKQVKIKTTLIATLVWHCSETNPPQVSKKKPDFKKEVRKIFKHGQVYNGATCWHLDDKIAFERGMNLKELSDKKPDYEEEFKKLISGFQIDLQKYAIK